VIQYATGFWGAEAASEVESNIRDKILDRPRAKEFANWEPPQPCIEELRNKLGGPSLSDDELLMRYVVGKEDVEALRTAGASQDFLDARNPLVALLQELLQRKDCNQIYVRKGELSVTLKRRAGSKS
jgi:oxaloacetate decarboxylase (Na+ extruding) subunit alpha